MREKSFATAQRATRVPERTTERVTMTTANARRKKGGAGGLSAASILENEVDQLDDWSQAWVDCKNGDGVWGGRARGGRGVQRHSVMGKVGDVSLEGVTLAYESNMLLERSRLRVTQNHRYALIGKNGCGKTTLLKRLARGMVPGWPLAMRCGYVEQELPGSDRTVEQMMADAEAGGARGGSGGGGRKAVLLEEQKRLEDEIDEEDPDEDDMARICEIEEELEKLEEEQSENGESGGKPGGNPKSLKNRLLRALGFTDDMRNMPTRRLSGGYRMRLALACVLLQEPEVLLLDEPTNHLDIEGVVWLERFLRRACPSEEEAKEKKKSKGGKGVKAGSDGHRIRVRAVVFVSHDTAFLDAVATDIINFQEKKLHYFPGTYSEFKEITEQTQTMKERLFENRQRKEKEALDFAKAQVASKSLKRSKKGHDIDPKKQRQAKSKLKKASTRAGFYRSDGRRYKTKSLRKLDESSIRLPERISAADLRKDRMLRFRFPGCSADALRLSTPSEPLYELDGCNLSPDGKTCILKSVSASITLGSRIGVVGQNGAVKSTLLSTIAGRFDVIGSHGTVVSNRNLRVAHVAQHHVEELEQHLDKTASQLLQSRNSSVTDLKARTHMGAFGLPGRLAMVPIRTLSGGQKARLALALATWSKPHIILLDEPTNHLDLNSLEALSLALKDFEGAVLLVSHNRGFLCSVCHELWWVRDGKVKVHKTAESSTEGFSSLFQKFCKASVARSKKKKRAASSMQAQK